METKLQSKQQYPRFIQNKPCGIDKFDGGSQERLAKTIARHFCQNDSLDEECTLPRIIGIEGIWGSGKSNVVKMLERELSDDYYFFEYDAWGHQEDLQRRSILELLTSKLIDDGILSGNATIKVKGGGTKTVSWSEKLKYLLARKTETVTEKYPLISNGMVAAFLVAVLTPIFTFIAYAVKPTPTTWWFSLLSIIIAALPVLIALCVWKWAYSKDHKYGWSYMLAIYQDKVEKDVCYETLSEDEPTVYEFKTWMQDISDFIKEKGQRKLVLVFDNMDRLPAEKVKELWSSIHTFFADSGFENVWAVIPFDETHLACAFGDETDEQTKQLTKYFINKTFPIVYRVAPPVITDYRSIFNKLFVEAFGETENEAKETINRIFRLVNPNANSTYTFPTLLQAITNCIDEQNVNKDNIGAIFTTYRLLASDEERPLPVTLDSTYINQLHSELETDGRNIKESGYYDLVAMQLAHGHSVSLIEGGDIKYVAELMDYYVDHGDLLVNSVGWNIPLLNETLQYMVNHKLGYKLLLSDILPQFEDIKNRIGVTDEVFIEHLAEWNTDLDKYITKNNIKDVIPDASFYDLTTKISNVLTDHINKIAFEALSEISVDTLYAQRTAHTSYYWFVAIKHLLAKIKSLPDNLTEFGKKILMDIASGTQSLNPFPNCFKNIVERLDKRKIKSTVTDIRNDFCIGKKTINAIKFQFFETWLRSHGNLKSQAGDVIDKIVKPVISDGACRSLILQNKDFYMDLINTAGDDAYELKKSLRNLIQKDSDPQLVKFVNSIDSVPEVETA